MLTVQSRLVPNNTTVWDQLDFFQSDGFTRVGALNTSNITATLFFGNVPQPWNLVNGAGINDQQIVSGNLYFNEIPGAPTFYNLRLRPTGVGFWRLVVVYPSVPQTIIHNFDVVSQFQGDDNGLKASFIRPHC
jgi:hypothetical protein